MSLSLTDSAAQHVKSYAGEPRLRVEVIENGCSGLSYRADIITKIKDSDHVYESKGVAIVVSHHSIPYLDGTIIDYVSDGINTGFEYNNPNAAHSCGCGKSFTTGE